MTQIYYVKGERLASDDIRASAIGSEITQLSDGGYVVVWAEYGTSPRILAQRFDADGAKIGDQILVSSGGFWSGGATVVATLNGGFLVNWYNAANDTVNFDFGYNVFGRFFTGSGTPENDEFLISPRPGGQIFPSVAVLTNGTFISAWLTENGGQVSIRMRAFDGYTVGPEVQVNTTELANSEWNEIYILTPVITALANGGFVVSWTSNSHDGDGYGISARLFTADGVAVGPEFQVNTVSEGEQFLPVAVATADGGVLAAWNSSDSRPSGLFAGTDITVQRFDAEGGTAGSIIHMTAAAGTTFSGVDVIELTNGGLAVGWGQEDGVFVQVYTADGQALGDPVRVGYTDNNWGIELAGQAGGGFVVTWTGLIGTQQVVYEHHFGATGQAGDDMIIYGDDAAESVIGGSGDDTVYAAGGNDTVDGLGGSDVLFGESGDDVLNGGDETDGLTGGAGADHLRGGGGNDYLTDDESSISVNADKDTLEGGDGDDTLVTFGGGDVIDGGDGIDTFVFYQALATTDLLIDMTVAATGITLSDGTVARNVENGAGETGSGNDTFVGGAGLDAVSLGTGNDQANAGGGNDFLEGGGGRDSLTGDDGDDLLRGGDGEDMVYGSNGRDVLDGEIGNDVLNGGADNDSMAGGWGDDTYFVDSQYDSVVENEAEGTDTVASWLNYSLKSHFENLVLLGSNDLYGVGNSLDNRLTGNFGNNSLIGAGGNDTLVGGMGDDTYFVDAAGDVVTEQAGEGTDTVLAARSYNLGAYLENLTFTGTDNFTGNGNSLANVITGNAGNNWLEGAAGNDTLIGGLGNDVFVIDADDVIVEAAGEGTEWVLAARSYTLGANLEHLGLTGSGDFSATGNSANNIIDGNSGKNVLTGAEGNDRLDGKAGADRMLGGVGDDTYYVDNAGDSVGENHLEGTDTVFASVSYSLFGRAVEILNLTGAGNLNGTGNSLANIITGTSGNNVLDGGAGADKLTGGLGDDTYYVDNAGDNVVELHWQGTDTVIASVSYSLLGRAVEVLTLTGAGNLNGVGNSLANNITGTSGNNVLDGGTGADKLTGGLGDDTYYVDNAGDNVVEQHLQGTDTVFSSVTYSFFGRAAEILNLTGMGNIGGTGNSLANSLTGNSGNNQLDGAAGNDTLTGGDGADIFLFETSNGKDIITDFSAAQNDTINVNAIAGGVANPGMVAQVGGNVVITFNASNTITVLGATQADVLSHMVW